MILRFLAINLMSMILSFPLTAKNKLVDREMLVPVHGTKLWCHVIGSGETIVIVHGGPGMEHTYFLPQLYSLALKYRLVFYDQRGSGRSPVEVDPASMTMDQFVEDLDSIRSYFKLDKMNLMGHSFGGLIAMRYAVKYPEHLQRLILMNPTPQSSYWRDSSLAMMKLRENPKIQAEKNEIVSSPEFAQKNPETMARFFRVLFKSSFFKEQYADSLTLVFRQNYPKTNELMNALYSDSTLKNYDLRHELKKVKCKTLLCGSEADFVPPEANEQLHKALKNSEYYMFESCGHFPFVESKDEFEKVIGRFMSK